MARKRPSLLSRFTQQFKYVTNERMRFEKRYFKKDVIEYLIVALFFLGLTAAYTNWVLFDISNKIFVGLGGGDATAGFLWLNTISPGLLPVVGYTDMVNHPYGEDLGSPTHMTYLLLWTPLRLLSYFIDPVVALNIVTISAFVFSALATYWLTKKLTRSVPVALFAGYAVAFVPYSLMKGSAHLSYIFSSVFVLIFAAFIGYWLRPTWVRAVLFALSISAAFYTDGYFILLASVMVAALCLGGFVYEVSRRRWGELWARVKGLSLALVVFLITLSPLAYVQLSQGEQVKQGLAQSRSDISKEFQLYKTELLDFIVPVEHPLLAESAKYQKVQGTKNLRSNPSENANYLGVIVVALGVIGLAFIIAHLIHRRGTLSMLREYDRQLFLLTGTLVVVTTLVFLAFMFSPSIEVAGRTIYLPGQLLLDYDVTLWRVMSRFFIPLHVVLVVFAAYSAWVLISTSVRGYSSETRTRLSWIIMLVLTLFTGLEYLTTANRPSFEMKHISKTYYWLKDQEDIEVIAELPVVNQLSPLTGDYLTHQLVHGKKLVNDRTGASEGTLGYYGTVDNPETLDFVRSRGADAVVVNAPSCDMSVDWGKLIYSETVPNIKNPKLCTYRLAGSVTDAVYVKTERGVLTTPLFSDTYEQTSVLEMQTVKLKAARYEPQQKTSGELRISLEFVPVLDPDFEGRWLILQEGKRIASGAIQGSRGNLNVVVDGSESIELRIVSQPREQFLRHGIGMQNIVASELSAR